MSIFWSIALNMCAHGLRLSESHTRASRTVKPDFFQSEHTQTYLNIMDTCPLLLCMPENAYLEAAVYKTT